MIFNLLTPDIGVLKTFAASFLILFNYFLSLVEFKLSPFA